MSAKVTALRSVDIGVTDLAAADRFYRNVCHLEQIAQAGDVLYFRGTGRYHHILSSRQAPRTGLIRMVLEAPDRAAVAQLHQQVAGHKFSLAGEPKALSTPGGGYGFGFKDPEGRNFAIVCNVADHADHTIRPDRPTKLSHVNLNCGANDASFAFMRDALGFTLSDQTKLHRFIRCNADHHSLVLGFNQDATLNHLAFEMPDLDSVMRGVGRMRDHGHAVEWGPGRHGPGNNVFAYFVGPEEFPVEFTSEMLQVDDSYRTGMPEDWPWPPGRVDHWGLTPGPSARVKRAQSLFRFSEDGHRLDE